MTSPSRSFPPRPVSKISQSDIAAACGVSEMTVSRVLRGQRGVSGDIAARVRNTARSLGYVPNRIAGALAGARVPLVAVIVPGMSNMVFPEVLMGLNAGLEGSDLQAVLGFGKYDTATEAQVLAELLAWRPSAVVLTGLEHDDTTRAMLARADIPVVEIMDSDGTGIDGVVGVSQHDVGVAMARAMIAAGHRNAVLLRSAQQGDRRQDSRFRGFEETLRAAGVPVLGSLSYNGASSVPKGRALAATALSHWPEVDFLYCTNDMIAAGALFALQAAGRKVPEETGLAGFSGLEFLDGITPRIATTDTRRFDIGRSAARMILSRLAGAPRGAREEITPRLDRGQTLRG